MWLRASSFLNRERLSCHQDIWSIHNWILNREAITCLITSWSSRLPTSLLEDGSEAGAWQLLGSSARSKLAASFALISRWILSPDSCFDLSSLNELCLGVITLPCFPFSFLPFCCCCCCVFVCFYVLEFASLGCESSKKDQGNCLTCVWSQSDRKVPWGST